MKKKILSLFFILFSYSSLPSNASTYEEFFVESGDFFIPTRVILQNDTTVPTIFWCHGGPHGRIEKSFLETIATITGCHVVGFDYRGSNISPIDYKSLDPIIIKAQGPDSLFYTSIDKDYGGGCMDDFKAVVSYVSDFYSDDIDTSKYSVGGGSFGGYMAALAITDPSFSKYFGFAALLSGFYDLGDYKEYNCPGNPKVIEIDRRRSPVKYTQNITQPFMIVHGGEDDQTSLVNLTLTKDFAQNALENEKEVLALYLEEEDHSYSPEAWQTIGLTWKEKIKDVNW
ncbi:MAG: prolyl oligopeptidase family serine peptidase [bacterium]|nr:prolyl oligopeptidase family serine peptidase [bacterium]